MKAMEWENESSLCPGPPTALRLLEGRARLKMTVGCGGGGSDGDMHS